MNKEEALSKMIAPGTPRDSKWRKGVIQIWLTRLCDKSCFSCTQGSNLQAIRSEYPQFMTLENFERAAKSLRGYFGVVGVFGGNPALHPEFPSICDILRKHIPFEQRGLWSNHPKGNGKVMRDTFNPAYSNLNVHLDQKAYDEFKQDWPECHPVGLKEDSRHSPVYGSMVDLGISEEERWERISRCDINQRWSAMIGQFRGKCRAWFCEVAGAQAMLRQHIPETPDTGVAIGEDGFTEVMYGEGFSPDANIWWKRPMAAFAHQVMQHCHHQCLVPMKGYGQLAQGSEDQGEQTTHEWEDLFRPKRNREIEIMEKAEALQPDGVACSTNYIQNARKS